MYNELKDILLSTMEQYPVLSKKDERALIKEYSKDPSKMRELLILHNLALIPYMAKRMNICQNVYDEFKTNFLESMVKLAQRFDPKKNTRFSTFILANVYRDVCFGRKNYLDEDNVYKSGMVYLDKHVGNDQDDNACTMYNLIDKYVVKGEGVEDGMVAENTNRIMLNRRLKELCEAVFKKNNSTKLCRSAFCDYFFKNMKMEDIATKNHCSRSNIQAVIQRCIVRIRFFLKNTTSFLDIVEYMGDNKIFGKDFTKNKKIEIERRKASECMRVFKGRESVENSSEYWKEADRWDLTNYGTYCSSYWNVYGDNIGMSYEDYADRRSMWIRMEEERSMSYQDMLKDFKKNGTPNWTKYGEKVAEDK